MQTPSPKIDLHQSYPCPCPRRQGKLVGITLTDAFGCDRCGTMFAVSEDGKSLSEIGSFAPYAPRWYWTGKRWRSNYLAQNSTSSLISLQVFLGFVTLTAIALAIGLEASLALPLVVIMVTALLLLSLWLLLLPH